jgi:general secretion pathway protein K
MEAFRKTGRRGAALMLSLWALFVLSAVVISWALDISARLALSGNANRTLEATALACSGSEVAQYPTIKPSSPVLSGGFGRNQTYEVHMTGEGGRLNLRWLLTLPEKPERTELLRKYLEIKGVDLNERDRMIDTLLDWVDPDNLVRLNGAEEEADYKPANNMITRLEELKKVKGWEEFTSMDDWDSDLTLDSTGPIDILWASREVLLALPGINEQIVDQFITMRSGADGIDGTEDDPFRSGMEALTALGLAQVPQITALVAAGPDPVWRVISVGKSGTVMRTVRMVIRKSNPVQLLSWKEF